MISHIKTRGLFGAAFALVCFASPLLAQEAQLLIPQSARDGINAVCEAAGENDLTADTIAEAFDVASEGIELETPQGNLARAKFRAEAHQYQLSVRAPGTGFQRTRLNGITASDQLVQQSFLLQAGPDCKIELARAVIYDDQGVPSTLITIEGEPPVITEREDLNPAVPGGRDPGGAAVAHVDTGINYTIPLLSNQLARNDDGEIYGEDFFDYDGRPFDLDPDSSPMTPRRHGTAVASLIVLEAPGVRLVPYRHPGRDFDAFADIIEDIAEGPARIVAMPLGGYRAADWEKMHDAILANPDILVIVSAGNNGRDIDIDPVYPASFTAENLLVVTSVDEFGTLPVDSNWGASTVDIAVPAEKILTIDHRGAKVRASGASYAVPRVAALAARIAADNPTWGADKIKAEIIGLAKTLPRGGALKVKYGWLPNPALVGPNPPVR